MLICFPFNCYHYFDYSKLDKMVLCTAYGVDTQDKTLDLQTSSSKTLSTFSHDCQSKQLSLDDLYAKSRFPAYQRRLAHCSNS